MRCLQLVGGVAGANADQPDEYRHESHRRSRCALPEPLLLHRRFSRPSSPIRLPRWMRECSTSLRGLGDSGSARGICVESCQSGYRSAGQCCSFFFALDVWDTTICPGPLAAISRRPSFGQSTSVTTCRRRHGRPGSKAMSLWMLFFWPLLATWRVTHLLASEDGQPDPHRAFSRPLGQSIRAGKLWTASTASAFGSQRR